MTYERPNEILHIMNKTIVQEVLMITHDKLSLYKHMHMCNIYKFFCLVLHAYMNMSMYRCKFCFFLFLLQGNILKCHREIFICSMCKYL